MAITVVRRRCAALTLVALIAGSIAVLVAQSSAAEPARPSSAKRWNRCANEGEICVVPTAGRVTVRYGVGRSWVSRRVVGSVACTNRTFGDPAVGRAKRCQWYGRPVTPPPTTTTTIATTTTTIHHHTGVPFVDTALIPAPNPGYSTSRIAPTNDTPRQGVDTGQFRFTCEFSHMNFDDPIVYPGRPGAAHLHTYFGNTAVNASTTAESLATTGNSTCAGGTANRTGYWVPAMIDTRTGRPIKPTDILVYYKSDPLPGSRARTYPAGLRMIAGDVRSTGPQNHITWACETATAEIRSTSIPTGCAPGNVVDMGIDFPMCWDGVNLDSPDHRSHMSYAVADPTSPTGVGCPRSHPVQFPNLTQKIRYRVAPGDDTSAWRLSSDAYDTSRPGGFSAHADWFNAWDPTVNRTWVERCLNANRDCHGFLLGDGTTLY